MLAPWPAQVNNNCFAIGLSRGTAKALRGKNPRAGQGGGGLQKRPGGTLSIYIKEVKDWRSPALPKARHQEENKNSHFPSDC